MSPAGYWPQLRAAIEATLELLSSPAGLLAKPLLRSDPTGETLQVIDKIADHLGVDRAQAISKALGLMEIWVDAQKEDRILVERPAHGAGKEYAIDVAPR